MHKIFIKFKSNFYVCEFTYENKTFNSVEHEFQSKKIELVDNEKAYWFCKNSRHMISIGDGLILRKNRKLVILNNDNLKNWNNKKHKVMEEILLAKFTQISIAKQVLLLTKNAILMHGTRGIPITRQYDLENIRNKIKSRIILLLARLIS